MMFTRLFFYILVGLTHMDIVAWIFKNTMSNDGTMLAFATMVQIFLLFDIIFS